MRQLFLSLVAFCFVGALVPMQSRGMELAEPQNSYDIWKPEYLTGNWGGLRSKLEKKGVSPYLVYVMESLGNPVGGRIKSFRYASSLDMGMALNLEKILGAKGLTFEITGDYRAGHDLTAGIGNFFSPAEIFALDEKFPEGAMRLYRLSLEQTLLDDRLSILGGRIGMGDDFLASDLYGEFVSAAFNANPIGIVFNLPAFSVGPVATWGWRARYQEDRWYAMGGMYYADDTIGADNKHGIDFDIRRDKGFISILQLAYLHNQAEGDTGLPGVYYVGSYYDSNRFENVGDPDKFRHGNYGLFFHLSQMVYAEPNSGRERGLNLFFAGVFAPFTQYNQFPYYLVGGAVYQGLFPSREDDTTSFGMAYGQVSSSILGQTYELVFELNHKFQVAPWLTIRPDMQYILRPGGTGDIQDALVLGWQMEVTF